MPVVLLAWIALFSTLNRSSNYFTAVWAEAVSNGFIPLLTSMFVFGSNPKKT